MLLGAHEHTIDDKNRLSLPAKFRQAFSDGVVVTRGLDRCLYAYRREDWARLVESRLAPLDPLGKEGRQMHRYFFAAATEADLDKQGRVMLPAALIDYAQLGREVVGAGGHAALLAADLHGRGKLIAIDRDPIARDYFDRFARRAGVQTRFLRGDFSVVLQQLAD